MLQPTFDRLRPGPGWQGVRKFLQQSGSGLHLGIYDLIAIHVDAAVADLPEVAQTLAMEDGEIKGDLSAFCRHVKGWLGQPIPETVAIALPRRSTEAWLVAAHTNKKQVEEIDDPAKVLVARGVLTERGGKVEKTSERYTELSLALPKLISNRQDLKRVPELDRFVSKVRDRFRKLKGKR
jgi:hypothetical protein